MRIVKRRKGFAYQVDCRSKGWTGPAQPEFLTKKEALDKAREVAALIKDKGIEGAGNYTTLLENGELAEFSNQLQPFGKTIADAVAHYLEVLRSNQSVETSPLVTETLKRWVAYKEAGTDGVLRPRSLGTLRYWSQRLAKIYPTQRLQHLSTNSFARPRTSSKQPRANQPVPICGNTLWVTSASSSTGASNKGSPTPTPRSASRLRLRFQRHYSLASPNVVKWCRS